MHIKGTDILFYFILYILTISLERIKNDWVLLYKLECSSGKEIGEVPEIRDMLSVALDRHN